jgi:hypothetical protein
MAGNAEGRMKNAETGLGHGHDPHCIILHSTFFLPEKLVEPEVVATSPYPGKSRVPVCCGFDSLKLVLAAGFAPALATFSTSCLCIGLRELLAQCHKEWSLQPVLLRRECASQVLRIGFPKRDCSLSRTAIFTKEIRRLLR